MFSSAELSGLPAATSAAAATATSNCTERQSGDEDSSAVFVPLSSLITLYDLHYFYCCCCCCCSVAELSSFFGHSVSIISSLHFLFFSLAFPKPHLCRSVCVCCVCGVSIMHLAPRSRHSILYGLSTACELSARLCCQCRRHHTEASDHKMLMLICNRTSVSVSVSQSATTIE